jgi:hypothetical protein
MAIGLTLILLLNGVPSMRSEVYQTVALALATAKLNPRSGRLLGLVPLL